MRVNNLPETNAGKIYDGLNNSVANTTFVGQNTVISDNQGNIGTLPFLTYPTILVGGTTDDEVPTAQIIRTRLSANSVYTTNLRTATFTLERKSVVTFYSNLSINVLTNYSGTAYLRDTVSRRIGSILYLNDNYIAIGGLPYYNYDPNSQAIFTGQYYSSLNKTLILEAGTYTVRLEGLLNTNESDATGIRASFGGSPLDILDVIAYPIP